MADEIKATATLVVKKPATTFTLAVGKATVSIDMTGTNYSGGMADVGFAAHEAIPIVDIGTPGWAYFRNQDTANFVEIGIDDTGTFEAVVKLKPGETALFRLAGTPYAKADTASVLLEYHIVED